MDIKTLKTPKDLKVTITDDHIEIPVFQKKITFSTYKIPYKGFYFDENSEEIELEHDDNLDLLYHNVVENRNLYLTIHPLDYLAFHILQESNVVNLAFDFQMNEFKNFDKFIERFDITQFNKIFFCFPEVSNKVDIENQLYDLFDDELKYKLVKLKPCYQERSLFNNLENINFTKNDKDPNKMTPESFIYTISSTFNPFPLKGIKEFNELESSVDSIIKNGIIKGMSTGFPALDPYFTIKTKNVTVVTGYPEHGKSNFVEEICLKLASRKIKSLIYPFESESPEFFFHNLIEKNLLKTEKSDKILNSMAYNNAKNLIQENIKMISIDQDNNSEGDFLDSLLEIAEKAVEYYDIKNIVLDPWNQIVQAKTDKFLNDGEYLSFQLGKVVRFAKKMDVHVFIIAHPVKPLRDLSDDEYRVPTPYDISGGANWFNKVSSAITVYRRKERENGLDRVLEVYIQKAKNKTIGRTGKVALYAPNPEIAALSDNFKSVEYFRFIKDKNGTKKSLEDFIDSRTFNKNKIMKNEKINIIETKATEAPF